MSIEVEPTDDVRELAALNEAAELAVRAIGHRIIGQKHVVEHLLIALFARGHALFVGVPGLAKTLLIQTLAEVLDLEFNRIQFTPDLMPSDVTGTEVLEIDRETGHRSFRFVKGPIFANLLLADEINRTPPKTQAALLQAMQEGQVTASGATHPLKPPFHVFATQNPIEQEGTYPLPEAQLDRFMFMLDVGYPSAADEIEIVRRTTGVEPPKHGKVLTPDRILALQALVRRLPVPESVVEYAVALTRATRPATASEHLDPTVASRIKDYVSFGAGPRASQYLVLGAKARAALQGRPSPEIHDVKAVAVPVLAHRVLVTYKAEAAGIKAADLVRSVIEGVKKT